jgi:hypothetical protein
VTSSLAGLRVASLECHVPPSGAWWASVVLPQGTTTPPLGRATLAIGSDLTLVGDVVRTGEEEPSNFRAIVRGGGGWWLPLATAASWQSDNGVKLSTVFLALLAAVLKARAAADLGGTETLPIPLPDPRIDAAYGWPAAGAVGPSTGAMVLSDLVRRGTLPTWRVGADGGTVATAWPTLKAGDAVGRVEKRRLDVGMREVALDTRAAAFLPGGSIDGVTIKRSVFRERAGELRVEAWSS